MKTLNERLEYYFSLNPKSKLDYDRISANFLSLNLDIFQKKIYPDLLSDKEKMTLLGITKTDNIFTFYYLLYDNKMLITKNLSVNEEDYKRYQEQVMELGRS